VRARRGSRRPAGPLAAPATAVGVLSLAVVWFVQAAPAAAAVPGGTAAGRKVITVAQDGSGDVRSVQAAIDAVPDGGSRAYTIRIKKGHYPGHVTVPAGKRRLSLQGATGRPQDVVLTAADSASTVGNNRASATVRLLGSDLTVADLTMENAYDEARLGWSPALAVFAGGDRQVFRNVRVLGNQDTLFADSSDHRRQNRLYVVNSYVAGDVDFIFGNSAMVFDRCEIRTLARGGAVTAPSTLKTFRYGILITDSSLTGPARADATALGRPWHPGGNANAVGSTVIRTSTIDRHITVSGPWSDMSGFSWRTGGRFAEYRNSGAGAGTGGNRPQLTDTQANQHTARAYLAGADGWNPTAARP
jgi:pectinesterase